MDLKNRWGDNVEKEGGILGPDGQPLVSQPPEPQAEAKDETAAEPTGEPEGQLNFFNYIASLGFQTMIFLGEMPNPVTNKPEKNLKQAKFLIDTLVILREKTKGNLTKEEDDLLNGSIYELQMRFVELSK
ncbi:MAG: DUF1844 domain-containing protein [Candidatus Omnitrophica bacterium]|nr:DUF1844 domain-containing protein [Candidatus Omnitrophota bacterium]MDE2215324.1 DUF1844 domain-containing protein [Candidatus Omnitrophota bacterium]MDE2231724.1 DUF1844 domain-containing protein [Candidatus Omnitrophota bacterium]